MDQNLRRNYRREKKLKKNLQPQFLFRLPNESFSAEEKKI
jgi:hypothetical protein